MSYTETDTEIIDVISFRKIKSRPGSMNAYFRSEISDVLKKYGVLPDINMEMRIEKETGRICIKPFK